MFTPGGGNHYSNIGYDILGLIAARAGGKPLAALYRKQIFEPLGLHATAYDPQGPIDGPHAPRLRRAAQRPDTTDWHWGIGAEGGIVSHAKETYDNLWQGGETSPCAGQAYGWSGGGNSYKTDLWVNDVGSRVTVLLLNARHYDTAQPAADQAAHNTLARLYCRA